MDLEVAQRKINALIEQGLLTPNAVLNTLSDRIKRFGTLNQADEQPRLQKTYDSLSTEENGTKIIGESTFLSFLQSSGFLPPTMTHAGVLIHRSILYLSQAPFYHLNPKPLPFDGLMRVIVWMDFERSQNVYDESADTRSRTPADSRRLLFQSFATAHDGNTLPFNAEDARKKAQRRAFEFPGMINEAQRQEFAKTNLDEDGDEMFHDVLDALFVAQPTLIWMGPIPRNAFWPLAKELHGGESLYHLSIPQEGFRTVVKLLVLAYFGPPTIPIEQLSDLDHVVSCLVRAFIQIPDVGITWDMFDQAVSKATPELFTGLRRLLSPFYQSSDVRNIAGCLSQQGKVASQPVLAQLGSIFSYHVAFEDLKLHKYHDTSTSSITASALAVQITAIMNDPVIVLISGKITNTDERAIFGYHRPLSDLDAPYVLFELSPIHDAFSGSDSSLLGGIIDGDDNLVFGEEDNGVAFVLHSNLRHLQVLHKVSGPMYGATEWRGDWTANVEVEEVEIWTEVEP